MGQLCCIFFGRSFTNSPKEDKVLKTILPQHRKKKEKHDGKTLPNLQPREQHAASQQSPQHEHRDEIPRQENATIIPIYDTSLTQLNTSRPIGGDYKDTQIPLEVKKSLRQQVLSTDGPAKPSRKSVTQPTRQCYTMEFQTRSKPSRKTVGSPGPPKPPRIFTYEPPTYHLCDEVLPTPLRQHDRATPSHLQTKMKFQTKEELQTQTWLQTKELQTQAGLQTKEELQTQAWLHTKELQTQAWLQTKEELQTQAWLQKKEELQTQAGLQTKELQTQAWLQTKELQTQAWLQAKEELQTQAWLQTKERQTKAWLQTKEELQTQTFLQAKGYFQTRANIPPPDDSVLLSYTPKGELMPIDENQELVIHNSPDSYRSVVI